MYRALEQVKDGRARRGVRYSVAFVLTLILLGKLVGEVKLSGIAQWVRLRKEWVKQHLGLERDELPCAGTYTYVLEHVDARSGDGGGAGLFDATAFPQAEPDRDAARVARASRADATSGR